MLNLIALCCSLVVFGGNTAEKEFNDESNCSKVHKLYVTPAAAVAYLHLLSLLRSDADYAQEQIAKHSIRMVVVEK